MASIGRVRVGNPEESVAATAVVLRFGVRLEHGRRKTTDRWPPPVSETMKGEAGAALPGPDHACGKEQLGPTDQTSGSSGQKASRPDGSPGRKGEGEGFLSLFLF
jgi:hypothetical protein